jgi:hypothetical protein
MVARPNVSKNVDTIPKHVSISPMLRMLAMLLLSSASVLAQANGTAYDALRTVGNQLNRDFVNRVISVSGVDGNPQPATWKIWIDDKSRSGNLREVVVTNGRIVSQRMRPAVGNSNSATIDPAKLNLDSSGAYEVANRTADSSHVPFALVSYTLRTDDRGNPTWVLTLQNQNRRPLGTIHIGATKGTVTRTEGMFQGIPADAVVEDQREGRVEYEERPGEGPMGRVRQMFYRARDDARDTFKRVRHNFADFIRGED